MSHFAVRLLGLAGLGSLGILARYFFSVAFEKMFGVGGFWATLFVNIVGSFGAGMLFVLATEHKLISENWRTVIAVGFFGGFTTFSAYALESVRLFELGDWKPAAAYWVLSPVFALIAVYLGMWTARLLPVSGVSL
jgi:CrcB protein